VLDHLQALGVTLGPKHLFELEIAIAGLSTTGSISLGVALVAGRNRVPRPAAGMTAFRTGMLHVFGLSMV
jgi:cyanate permease